MRYLAAILVPPIYFMTRKRTAAAVVTSFLFLLSCIFYIMIVLAPVGLVLWLLSAIVAVWDLRKSLMREQAKMIAEEMTAASRQRPPAK